MPDFETGQRLVVVGKDRLRVSKKMTEINRGAQQTISKLRREKEVKHAAAKAEFQKQLKSAKAQQSDSGGLWDVKGSWAISCPKIEDGWGTNGEELSVLVGVTPPNPRGQVQMYAEFDFNIIT